jgi:hypothetical protein
VIGREIRLQVVSVVGALEDAEYCRKAGRKVARIDI